MPIKLNRSYNNNIGHEVTNNLIPSHAGKLEQNVLYAMKLTLQ